MWLQAEEVPSREQFYARKSKELFLATMQGDGDAADLAGRKFCDYGLHGLEQLASVNHPQASSDLATVTYLKATYHKISHHGDCPVVLWKVAIDELIKKAKGTAPPLVWVINEKEASVHHPKLLCWTCGTNFENSAFFEVFQTPRKAVHVFQIKRFAGRSFRSQVSYSMRID